MAANTTDAYSNFVINTVFLMETRLEMSINVIKRQKTQSNIVGAQ